MKALAAGMIAVALPFAASAQVEKFALDPFHTVPYFEIDHLGFATIRGRFAKPTGSFSIDWGAKTGTAEIVIPTASVDTGDPDRDGRPRTRDEHLRNPDFFNAAEFPTMTYRATAVKFAGDRPDVIEGNLTLLGVTRPVALKIERWRCGPDPRTQGKRYQCGGNATGAFKRSDFGMKFGLPTAIGDEVNLWMSFYGFRQ
ncbi:MAG TPA: YceI family protein [Burkholderiales bacterium]|nr:YceI family protein [Burkholderiales bacterium]